MKLILIIFLMGLFSCENNKDLKLPNPNNLEIVAQIQGDLNSDGIDEVAVVFNTNDEKPFGRTRLLQIFHQKESKLHLWTESTHALRRSEQNGVKNNKVELKIENGDLIIKNSQISDWQLIETNRYRLIENEFKLIDYKSKYGKECEYWIEVNFNSNSSDLEFIKSYESCNSKDKNKESEIENFKLKNIELNLKNRTEKYIEFLTPKFQYEWNI